MNKINWRKIAIISLLSVLQFTLIPMASWASFSTTNERTDNSIIMPRLSYIEDCQNSLEIANGTAIVDCWVNGDVLDATKAKVIAELQVKSGNNWIAYGTWVDTQNDYEAYVYETKSVKAGNTYRVKATFTVWEGSQSETVTSFTDEMTA